MAVSSENPPLPLPGEIRNEIYTNFNPLNRHVTAFNGFWATNKEAYREARGLYWQKTANLLSEVGETWRGKFPSHPLLFKINETQAKVTFKIPKSFFIHERDPRTSRILKGLIFGDDVDHNKILSDEFDSLYFTDDPEPPLDAETVNYNSAPTGPLSLLTKFKVTILKIKLYDDAAWSIEHLRPGHYYYGTGAGVTLTENLESFTVEFCKLMSARQVLQDNQQTEGSETLITPGILEADRLALLWSTGDSDYMVFDLRTGGNMTESEIFTERLEAAFEYPYSQKLRGWAILLRLRNGILVEWAVLDSLLNNSSTFIFVKGNRGAY